MYLVFDIGGTNMRIAVSADGKTLTNSKIVPTPKDFELGIQTLKQIAEEFSNGAKIEGVAGGIAGPLDQAKTMLARSPHLADWIQKPLKSELEKIFGCSASLENDCAVGGLGEATVGAGQGHKIVAYLAIGTGVGGSRIVNGKIDSNALGFEPGHQIIVPDGEPCECGGKGHLESYVGGKYLEKIYHQKGEDLKDPQIWDEVSRYLAIGLTNITVHWSPDIIVLGGNVTKSIPLPIVQNYLNEFLPVFSTPPQIIKAILGDDAGLYGALSLLH